MGQNKTLMKRADGTWSDGGAGSGLNADLIRGLPADFTSDLSSAGYQKLPSGLIIQWGVADTNTGSSSTTNTDVTFPIAFPNACLQVVGSPVNGANDNWGVIIVRITNFDTDSFNCYLDSTDPNQNIENNVQIRFIAIGY